MKRTATGAADFWSRRKARVAAEEAAEARDAEARADAAQEAALAEKSDAELCEELGLPDPDTLQPGDDFRAFMAKAVPERLRRRALRRLWLSNPALANLDGMVEYGENQGEVFLARDISRDRNYSEATAQKIDGEIKRVIDRAYADAKRILLEKRDKLELIAQALLEYETLDASHIMDLIEYGEMRNPPTSPRPPSLPDEPPQKAKAPKADGAQEDDDGPLPGEVVGAPA